MKKSTGALKTRKKIKTQGFMARVKTNILSKKRKKGRKTLIK